jgi:hypothetical protein
MDQSICARHLYSKGSEITYRKENTRAYIQSWWKYKLGEVCCKASSGPNSSARHFGFWVVASLIEIKIHLHWNEQ